MNAFDSTDPDGDSIRFLWFNYPEAGSLEEEVRVDGAENVHEVYVIAPEVEKEETIHIILKVSDKGTPPLSRYKRVIVSVLPK